jgi:hypothetical protein
MSNYETKPINPDDYSISAHITTENDSINLNYACDDDNDYETAYSSFSNTTVTDDTKEQDKLLLHGDFISNMSSFAHLPPKFLGIDTRTFGKTSSLYFDKDKPHPFLLLKEFSMNSSTTIDDRLQCMRYMIHIPYINGHEHCMEACKVILEDENIEVNKRFYFFANNDKYFKLTDQLVYDLHPFFLKLGIQRKYPLSMLLISARYILSFYPDESQDRDDTLDFVLDLIDDKQQTENIRGECADILYSFGREEEAIYGVKILQELGYMDQDLQKTTLYTNRQNVHDKTINDSVRRTINSLHKEYLKTSKENLLGQCTLEFLHKLVYDEFKVDEQDSLLREKIQQFFVRVMTDPTKFENLTLCDIFLLVLTKVQSLQGAIKEECYKRIIEEIEDSSDTCHTGYVSRLVNVLSGFVEGEDYILTIDPRDELRSAVFARVNTAIANLPIYLKEDVTNSLWGDDKSVFNEFLGLYGETIKDELIEEYKNILTEKEVNEIYEKSIKKFQGN